MRVPHRRSFLKHTLAAGAAAALLPTTRVLGANDDVRVAVVGLRSQGKAHLRNYLNMQGVRVVALCDVDQAILDAEVQRLAQRGQKVHAFRDFRKLLERNDIDAVSLVTPNHWHALGTVWACQAGKDVCVEKPVSHNIWEGRKMAQAARKYGRIVQADLDERSRRFNDRAFDYLHSGALGKILAVRGLSEKPGSQEIAIHTPQVRRENTMHPANTTSNAGRITRRGFLRSAAMALGSGLALPRFVPGSALGLDGKVAPSNRIGIGFIGLGRQAVHANMSVFLRSGYCQTVALCDVDRWRLAIEGNPSAAAVAKKNQWDLALLKDTFRTTDFRELLAREGLDAVMISTPDHWHVPIALAAIKAGKDVALEKPIGLAIAHGRVLADAAAKAKTVFRTDSNFRSEPELFRAVSLVRTGKIGQLKTIRMSVPIYPVPAPHEAPMPVPADLDYEMWQGPAQRQPYTEDRVHPRGKFGRPGWYSNRLYCDGMICNWGHHPADLVQWANDTERTGPVEVEGRGDLPPAQGLYNTIGEFQARYRYANGVELHYIGRKDYQEGESYMLFEGTEGWVRAWRAPNRIEAEPKSILAADVKFEEFPFLLRNEKTDFIECVRAREPQTLEDAEVGHRSSTVVQLAYIACLLGRKLKWDPVKEEFPGDDEANTLVRGQPGLPPWTIQ